jgi:hypothetical protein
MMGWQRDQQGGIWNYECAPYVAKLQGEGSYSVQLCKSYEPVSVSDKEVVLRFRSVDVQVDSHTKRIVSSHQMEKLQVYIPIKSNDQCIECKGSLKSFDQEGKPLTQAEVTAIRVRKKSFQEVGEYKGSDVRKLFRQYLIANDLANLVPVYSTRAVKPLEANEGVLTPEEQALRAKEGALTPSDDQFFKPLKSKHHTINF